MKRAAPAISRCHTCGFSLLETTIAVAVLGVGLIMVAAIFPVALTEHRESTDQTAAAAMLPKAKALMRARLTPSDLWVHPDFLPPAGALQLQDSPWYLLPSMNLAQGADNAANDANNWDDMQQPDPTPFNSRSFYSNLMNGASAAPVNGRIFFGLDILSDRTAPYTTGNSLSPYMDSEFFKAPSRMTWIGFYRRLATGSVPFAVAICKQRSGQTYAEQNLVAPPDMGLIPAAQNSYSKPLIWRSDRRLPVPWRISVGYAGGNQLSNTATSPMLSAGIGLATLAPPGSKIVIQGGIRTSGSLTPSISAGRILTVTDAFNATTIDVAEDITDLPLFENPPGSGNFTTFDLWVFPPAVKGGVFEKASPLMVWRTNL